MYEVQLPWINHQVRKLRPRVHTPVGSPNHASSQLPTKPASQVSKSSWTSSPRIQSIQTFLWLQWVQMCIIPAISLLSIYRKETKILHDKPQVKTACASTSEFLTHQRITEIKFVFTKLGGNVVQLLNCVRLFATPWTAAYQVSLSFITSPWVCSNSRPLSQWFHPTISSFVTPFSSCLQSFPASGFLFFCLFICCCFAMSWLFAPVGQITRTSASAPVLPASPSSQSFQSGLISFRIDWFHLLAVQGTLKNLLQHHSSKASILYCYLCC